MKRLLMIVLLVLGTTCFSSYRASAQVDLILGVAKEILAGVMDKKTPQNVVDVATKGEVSKVNSGVNTTNTKLAEYQRKFNTYNENFDEYSKKIQAVYDSAKALDELSIAVKKARQCADLSLKISQCDYNLSQYIASGELSSDEIEAMISYYQVLTEIARDELSGVSQLYKRQGMTLKERYDLLDALYLKLTAIYNVALDFNGGVSAMIGNRAGAKRDVKMHCSMYR